MRLEGLISMNTKPVPNTKDRTIEANLETIKKQCKFNAKTQKRDYCLFYCL